jgi:hypothetical protein
MIDPIQELIRVYQLSGGTEASFRETVEQEAQKKADADILKNLGVQWEA